MTFRNARWLSLVLLIGACNERSEINPRSPMEVYPNPAANFISVKLKNENQNLITLHVFDPEGKRVAERDLQQLPSGDHTFQINISEAPSGYLYVVAETSTGKLTAKVLKE